MELSICQRVPDFQVHHAAVDYMLASQNLNVGSFGNEWQFIASIPSSIGRKTAMKLPLLTRLLRGGIHVVLPINDDHFLAIAERQIFVILDHEVVRSLYRIPRGKRPLRRGVCVIDAHVLIGEYWGNPERTAVNIYKVAVATGDVEIFYQFPAQTVRHVHTVDKDPYSNQLWVSTGDEDPECKIILLDATSGESILLGEGSQKWRTVSFAFRPDAVYWGTDNHLGQNEIWRYDRNTEATTKVGDITGPVYYNACLEDAIIFGTTMEKGEGQQDGYGRLYAVDNQDNIQEVWKAEKDKWSAHYFGYGVFEFAEGSVGKNKFWVTAKGFNGGLQSLLFELKHE